MNDRLKTISLRQFRLRIAELDEVVEVSRRDEQNNQQVLGYWTPYMTRAPGSAPLPPFDLAIDEPAPLRNIQTKADVATMVKSDPVRAVPKPSAKKRP